MSFGERKSDPLWPWVMTIVLGILFCWAIAHGCQSERDCEARGGIYLWREFKCVPGFPR